MSNVLLVENILSYVLLVENILSNAGSELTLQVRG
jgi:hypothetical protein